MLGSEFVLKFKKEEKRKEERERTKKKRKVEIKKEKLTNATLRFYFACVVCAYRVFMCAPE